MAKNQFFKSRNGLVTITVVYKPNLGEYQGLYKYLGKVDAAKTNFTDSLDDAIGTAKATIAQYDAIAEKIETAYRLETNITAIESYIESMNCAIEKTKAGSVAEHGYFIEKLERMANRLGYGLVKTITV